MGGSFHLGVALIKCGEKEARLFAPPLLCVTSRWVRRFRALRLDQSDILSCRELPA
jgi:hypothetical protein